MTTFRCKNCGCQIVVNDGTADCSCKACGTVFNRSELESYEKKVKEVAERIKNELNADKRRKEEIEEAKKKRQIEEENLKIRAQEAEIKSKELAAQAELERAKNEGKTVIYNGPDIGGLQGNAVTAFTGKDFKAAYKAAHDIIASDAGNVIAMYIIAYENYVDNKKMFAMDDFVKQLPDISMTISKENAAALEKLFRVSTLKIANYETQVLDFVCTNDLGDSLYADEVCAFVDGFSPYIINTRANHKFLTPELFDIYSKLSEFCSIPKTCYALIGAIQNNPESPLKNEQFYLRERNRLFYDEYVVKVGEVIGKMKSDKYRAQFKAAYEKVRVLYCQKAHIE